MRQTQYLWIVSLQICLRDELIVPSIFLNILFRYEAFRKKNVCSIVIECDIDINFPELQSLSIPLERYKNIYFDVKISGKNAYIFSLYSLNLEIQIVLLLEFPYHLLFSD